MTDAFHGNGVVQAENGLSKYMLDTENIITLTLYLAMS